MESELKQELDEAAAAVGEAEALLITAGAGFGVDSGLPDFRGPEGFWKAYPAFRRLGLDFMDLAQPRWFEEDPALAWGFYGHRLALYRTTRPHHGFQLLQRWSEAMAEQAFVFTTNVDGQFRRAGFSTENLYECHGAIDWLQCIAGCGQPIFSADPFSVQLDPATCRATGTLPRCPGCDALARPNILLFDDGDWDSTRSREQRQRLSAWLRRQEGRKMVVIEGGAGTAIPSARLFGENVAAATGGRLIRINPREPAVEAGGISLPMGARKALEAIDSRLQANGKDRR